jgi:hypothetical protein
MRKPRKFNRRLASKIMAGKVKGRIRTRHGHPVRILAWNAMGNYPIVGLIFLAEIDTEMSWQWTKQGIAFGHSDYSSTVDYTLVIELKENNQSTVPRFRRGPNKRRRK